MPRITRSRLVRRVRRIARDHLPLHARAEVRAWAEAYERAAAAAEGRKPGRPPATPPARVASAPKKRERAKGLRTEPAIVSALLEGQSLEVAWAHAARTLLVRPGAATAQSFVDTLLDTPGAAGSAHLASGIVAAARGHLRKAAQHLAEVDHAVLTAQAPVETVDALNATDPARCHEVILAWLDDADATAGFAAPTWFHLLKRLFVLDDAAAVARAFERLVAAHARDGEDAWPIGTTEIEWLRPWIGGAKHATAPTPEGRIAFALMDYRQPGRGASSQNIGDQIQTLASLGHVVRHQNLTFHGDEDVVGFVNDMQQRVRPELRVDSAPADVQLYRMDRDGSSYQAFPEKTWMLEFGWHMHALFNLDRWDFPLHPNLRPIFVSFHCNKRGLLTPEALDYLRAHGPIGCRDWTTVDLLLSLDVPAFFSGCLTTTVSTVFPERARPSTERTGYVDVVRSEVPEGAENIKQSYALVKRRTFIENMREAVDLLEGYRRTYTKLVTKRLHCYLPTRSLGLEVDFEPTYNSDVRFAGLFRLSHEEFEAIRLPMIARLQPVLTAIFSGAQEEDVYRIWRETVAEDVEIARRRHLDSTPLAPAPVPAAELARAAEVRTVVEATEAGSDPIDLVLLPARGRTRMVANVIASAERATSRPLAVWVVGDEAAQVPALATLPTTSVRTVDTRGVTAAGVGDRSALVHALLPELLADIDRAVVLPVEAAVLTDLGDLAAADLGSTAVAARKTSRPNDSGFALFYSGARRLDDRPAAAYDLYRRIHARHVFDFDAFDTDVMVLDTSRLRSDGFADELLPYLREFSLNGREAFHLWFGPDRTDLDPAWATVPSRELVAEPHVLHWAEAPQPWGEGHAQHQDVWLTATAR